MADGGSSGSTRALAVGTGLAGVLLGAIAMLVGLSSRPPAPAPAPVAEVPVTIPEPTLADVVDAALPTVVSLRTPTRAGAGVIVDPDGWVITNMHVVGDVVGASPARDDSSPRVRARFVDGRELAATIVVVDREEDLAVLKLQGAADERFAAASLGQSSRLRVGDPVFAIGNPHGLSHSVATGIVSALGRTGLPEGSRVPLLQLDAAINVGNSGGPLFDRHGALVGIVTARSREAEGIAFALPVDHVAGFLRAVTERSGRRAGAIGVRLATDATLPAEVRALGYAAGLPIAEIVEDGAAAKAGLAVGDVVVEVRGLRLDGRSEASSGPELASWFAESIRALFPGEKLEITVVRAGALRRVELEAGAASEREQTFIDAEVLLGVRLTRTGEQATIAAVARPVGLGRYGDVVIGATIVGLLGREISGLDGLGRALAELRTIVRSGEGELLAWVRLRGASGQEGSWPVTVE